MTSIPSQYPEFDPRTSNGYISKTKDFFWNFYYISQIYKNSEAFAKKVESASLSICEVIDAQKSRYLNV